MSSWPNVLLVMMDQWPGKLVGADGHPAILTPTLDHLARIGTRYPRAYSECPICIPARRTLMTGTSPRTHGDRVFKPAATMPPRLPTLAQTFRGAGYQAYAVGKLHVYPQRDRIGFDDVLLAEEGRPQLGAVDDYDLYLAEAGHAGEQFAHGMSNNDYLFRPWHLDERLHVTNWITREAAKMVKRRDPTRPGFWHVSYTHPHPPIVPLESYLAMYRELDIDAPVQAEWANGPLPYPLEAVRAHWPAALPSSRMAAIRRAFFALCTHIDHQLRLLLGTLREEGLLDDTIVLVTADHGDMLGDFGLWAKRLFYEGSARVPMLLVGTKGDKRVPQQGVDARVVGLQDVMPTLLDLAGVTVPDTVEGLSMTGDQHREVLVGENAGRTRMRRAWPTMADTSCSGIPQETSSSCSISNAIPRNPATRPRIRLTPMYDAISKRRSSSMRTAWTSNGSARDGSSDSTPRRSSIKPTAPGLGSGVFTTLNRR
jgi:arylsulfatase